MSLEKAKAFIEKVQGDKTLQQETSDIGQDVEKLLALAQREGFEFGKAEFARAVRDAGYELEAQLSDDELDNVVGGTLGVVITGGSCDPCNSSTSWPDC